jgi:exosortase A
MTTAAPAAKTRADAGHGWGELLPFGLAALAGLACLGLLFHAEIAAAVGVWQDSTAYSHCFLVLPIALWLAWDRRDAARGLRPQPVALPALAIIPFGLAWFAAERLGLMEGRQLAALGVLESLLVALLGWRLARAQAPALIYLVFLVPVGSFLVPSLQHFTAGFIDIGLDVFGIPHAVDTFTIDIPEGLFYVAEACAGLRFLIAAVAFGVLYGFLTYRSIGKRLGFLAASIVVPIIANGIRALGIVVAGHLIGDAEAATADHIIYGWGFFSVVIVLLALAGLPFREDTARPAAPAAPPTPMPAPGFGQTVWIAGLAALLAAMGPLAANTLNHPGAAPDLALPGFAATADCRATGAQTFSCHGIPLTATLRALPPHAPPATLRAARADATGEHDAADAVTSTLTAAGQPWRLVELQEPSRLTATAAWIDGQPDPGGLAGRLRLAWDSIAGSTSPTVLVAFSLHPDPLLTNDDRDAAQALLRHFIDAQAPLLAAIPHATTGR